jgi:putative transposase
MNSQAPSVFVAIEEASVLSGLSRATIYRRIGEGALVITREEINGQARVRIALSSLPASAQALYWSKRLLPSVADSVSDPLNLAEIPDCLRVEAHRRLTILDAAQPIFERPRGLRKAVLARFCRDRDISTGTLHTWRAAYQRGGLPALLPQWGKTRGTFLAISDVVHDFLKAEHCSPKRPDRTTLYRFLRTFCGSIHEPCPSHSTVNKFLNSLPPPAVILAREGNQAWRAQCEPKCERDLSDLLVGEWWVSDHREFDVFVQLPWWNHVTREMEHKIFRPWLTAWLDLRSRALVGYVVCMNPSSESIACALRDGILKHGLPAHLYRDRGKDYKANWWGGKYITHRNVKLSDDAMLLLKPGVISESGIQLHAAKAYTPWAKPIEGWFGRTFPQWERALPGWCGSDNKERPEKLADEIARRELLTLDEFTQRVGGCIDEGYNRTANSALAGATPAELWRGVAIQRPNPRTLDLLMMKHKPVQVTHQGIKLFNRLYWSDELMLRVGTKVSVRYSPAEIGRLIVLDPATHQFVCEAINEPAMRMGACEADMKRLALKKKQAKEAVQEYSGHRRVLREPDRAAEELIAERRAQKVVTLPPRDPSPAAGTVPVVKIVPQLDRAAQILEQTAGAPSADSTRLVAGRTPRRDRSAAGETTSPAAASRPDDRYDLLAELLAEGGS